ncbi:BOS complex subunit NCLN [Drosophila tropicalis]|uniref:BOS complex subunit NCLN n=1 Tax=Drosophila tropicalis TaxID=46794 RepID=UPI0035ABFF25
MDVTSIIDHIQTKVTKFTVLIMCSEAFIFRTAVSYCLFIALLAMCSPVAGIGGEFQVKSMVKFDLNGDQFGSRTFGISMEVKSLYTWSTARHVVFTRLLDISVNDFNIIRQKSGGLIIMLPTNVSIFNNEIKEQITILEQAMLFQSAPIPVYFAPFNKNLDKILDEISYTTTQNINQDETAFTQLVTSISANGYHVTVSDVSSSANKNSKIPVVYGELIPNNFVGNYVDNILHESNLPVILITASLKTFGIFNDYPLNADAAVLMILMEMFSKLHSVTRMTPKYSIAFLLSDSGLLLNFQGAKKWLEIDENLSLQGVEYVMCLDTIIQSLTHNEKDVLFMHVSKPPKEKSSISQYFKLLKLAADQHGKNFTVEGVHKKINLAELKLAWEHERFSIKRYPAFTLSSVKASKSPIRTSIFTDDKSRIITEVMLASKIISEALAAYIYKLDQLPNIFTGYLEINDQTVMSYLGVKSILENNDIKDAFSKYLKNVKVIYDKADVREPDFLFYNGNDVHMNVYRVKPAIFDLFLTFVIGIYLVSVYLAIQNFPRFYEEVSKFSKQPHSLGAVNGNLSDRNKWKLN